MKPRLKIAVVSASIYPYEHGGIARWMTDLAPVLISQGHDVRLITRHYADIDSRAFLLKTPKKPKKSYVPEAFPHINEFASGVVEVLDDLRDDGWNPDIVYGTAWDCEVLGAIRSQKYFVVSLVVTPLRVTLKHSGVVRSEDAALFPVMQDLEAETIRSSNAIHAISHSIIETIASEYSIDFTSLDVEVIPLGLPDNDLMQHKNHGPKVLFVGRREERKGIDLLLDAIPTILKDFPKTRFTIAGQEAPSARRRTTFQQAFNEKNSWRVRRKVKFLSDLSDDQLENLYASHDITCIPSRYESFGLVAIEAMRASSIPVVTPGSGLAEIVTNGQDGIVMKDISTASIEREVSNLLSNSELVQQLRKKARTTYTEKFQIEKSASDLVAFFERGMRS